jgi:hypothetical protein
MRKHLEGIFFYIINPYGVFVYIIYPRKKNIPCNSKWRFGTSEIKAGTQGLNVLKLPVRIFSNMLYVQYVHLIKSKYIHKTKAHLLVREDVT